MRICAMTKGSDVSEGSCHIARTQSQSGSHEGAIFAIAPTLLSVFRIYVPIEKFEPALYVFLPERP